MGHVILETVLDTLKLLPFLFLTYLLMEWLENKTGERVQHWIERSGKVGPLLGGALGVVPQCGFSAAAAGLYSGGVITVGTLLAIFLSTSDEMLPILLSEGVAPLTVLRIVGTKVAFAVLFGFLFDVCFLRYRKRELSIHDLCERSHCHCEDEEKSILRSALHHTVQITLFLLVVSLVLHTVIYFVGEDTISAWIVDLPVVGNLISALVGLIPNCASSVVITKLYVDGVISAGAMMSGLLTGSGIGILVLFRTHPSRRHSLLILTALYIIGVLCGILLDLTGLGTLLIGTL